MKRMTQSFHILLVEDNPGDAMLLEEFLLESKQFAFNITNAQTLEAGLEHVQKNDYDIVLLDLGLPDSQDLEALEKMLEKVNHLPIVIITGIDDDETGWKAINMGAQSYIVKGLANTRLITDTITHAIERNKILLELKEKDAEMKKINTQLQEANHAKERLIALLSHDLRGPVNSLVKLLETVVDYYADLSEENKQKYLNACIKSGKNAVNLMETLLDWAQLQSNEKKIEPEETALMPFVVETLEPVMPTAVNKKIKIVTQISEDIGFYADKNMIATVVRNLVTNAIKFTPQNGIITIKSKKSTNGGVLISVEDTGVGIKKEDISKIFDITAGFTTPGTENEKGSGFGMILCKEFVEKNKGTIIIESEIGKGTTVSFKLPVKEYTKNQEK